MSATPVPRKPAGSLTDRDVRIFPNQASCLLLVRAAACEIDEHWLDEQPYLSMNHLYPR